jgi:plastocyanin
VPATCALTLGVLLSAACGGGDDASLPTTGHASTATTASGQPTCAPGTSELHVIAVDVDYDTDCLAARAGTPFTIAFENRDEGVKHSIVIRRGTEQNLFEGEIITGPATVTYRVDAIAAGEYRFFCVVHPFRMAGAFLVG